MPDSKSLERIRKGAYIVLRSGGEKPVSGEGYVGEVFEDRFEFRQLLNAFRHFSNYGDPPEFEEHVVYFKDVTSATR